MYGAIFFIAGLTAAVSSKYDSCPPESIGSPCTCNVRVYSNILGYKSPGLKVVCSNINEPSTLLNEIQKFRGRNIHGLILENLQLPYLPPGLFLGTTVKALAFKDSKLDNLYSIKDYNPSPFAGLEDSLEELDVYNTKEPAKWYWPDLSNLRKLKRIEFVQSPIDFVSSVFAEIGHGSLESITVAYSRVYRLHPQAFPSLTNLKEVNFRGNFLPYMSRTMFPDPAHHLKSMDLSDNKLFTLPENMFDNMPALEYLDLSQNEFKSFQDFPAYNTLTTFYISRNPFACDCHLLPLKQRLESSELKYHDISDISCRKPESSDEQLIKDIPNEELKCL